MAHLIFLIPGMGKNGAGWSDGVQARVRNLYQGFDPDDLTPFDETFVFHELHYDKIFETIRQHWRDDFGAVLDQMKAGNLSPAVADKLGAMNQLLTDDQFFGTHILDVLFYRFIETVTQAVRTRVCSDIVTTLQDTLPANWSILAHSLGTSVIHDSLHALYTHGDLDPLDTRPHLLATLANVSRVLESDAPAHGSGVRPAADGADGYCNYFLNVAHTLDPFTMVRPFHPPPNHWPGPPGGLDLYHFAPLTEVYEVNVHDCLHYLNDPLTHIPLFEWLGAPLTITHEIAQQRIGQYRAAAPINQKLAEYKQKQAELQAGLEQLQQQAESLVTMINDWLNNLRNAA